MSTRRMTRETRVEYRYTLMGPREWSWRPVAPGNEGYLRDKGYKLRTVERWVTEWVEVDE